MEPTDNYDLVIANACTSRQRTGGTVGGSSGLLQLETRLQKTRAHAITPQ